MLGHGDIMESMLIILFFVVIAFETKIILNNYIKTGNILTEDIYEGAFKFVADICVFARLVLAFTVCAFLGSIEVVNYLTSSMYLFMIFMLGAHIVVEEKYRSPYSF